MLQFAHSADDGVWFFVHDLVTGTERVFVGNTDRNSEKSNIIPGHTPTLQARYRSQLVHFHSEQGNIRMLMFNTLRRHL